MSYKNLPWIEKYRPNKLKNLILEANTKNRIKHIIKNKEISNLILTGDSGIGKTSTILYIAKKIYKKNYDDCVIELNASDNRGLDIIYNLIIHFCKKKVLLPDNLPKLIILDEADNITIKAQNTIINLMDKYKDSIKFAFTCNNSLKLNEGIQSRCLILKYTKLKAEEIKIRLLAICKKENIKYEESGIDTLIYLCNGDIRKAINCLEITYNGFDVITIDNVYKICEKSASSELLNIINLCLSGDLKSSLNKILLFKQKGYNNSDILLLIIDILKNIYLDEKLKISMIDYTSECFIKINDGIDTDLQLFSCLCNFYKFAKN